MTCPYDPRSLWYFTADDGRVFKAPDCRMVDPSDADYRAFVGAQGYVPGWPHESRDPKTGEPSGQTDAALDDVLRPYGLSTAGPLRSAEVSDLLDALGSAKRAAIVSDNKDRLVARGGKGPVTPADPKVIRAAADVAKVSPGFTSSAWFDLLND